MRIPAFSPIPIFLVLCVTALALAGSGEATVYAIRGNNADAEVSETHVVANGNYVGGPNASNATKVGTLLAGTYRSTDSANNSNYAIISPVFVFQLPTLAAGETLASADLRFHVSRSGSGGYNADLYGLGYRSLSTVQAGDFYFGSLDPTNATLIQDNFATPSSPTGATATTTNDTGDAALLAYLNAQYSAGAVGGDFVFIRFSPDFTTVPTGVGTGSIGFAVVASNENAGTPITNFPQAYDQHRTRAVGGRFVLRRHAGRPVVSSSLKHSPASKCVI